MARPSKYTPELRRRAVEEVLHRDRTVTEVARSLSIATPETLRRWVIQAKKDRGLAVCSSVGSTITRLTIPGNLEIVRHRQRWHSALGMLSPIGYERPGRTRRRHRRRMVTELAVSAEHDAVFVEPVGDGSIPNLGLRLSRVARPTRVVATVKS